MDITQRANYQVGNHKIAQGIGLGDNRTGRTYPLNDRTWNNHVESKRGIFIEGYGSILQGRNQATESRRWEKELRVLAYV